jgi:hypothetical protein
MIVLRVTTYAVGLIVAATMVFAQANQDQQICAGDRDPLTAISACTRVIEGGNLKDLDVSDALYNRGAHFANVSETERAIADYSRAIVADQIRHLAEQSLVERVRAGSVEGKRLGTDVAVDFVLRLGLKENAAAWDSSLVLPSRRIDAA